MKSKTLLTLLILPLLLSACESFRFIHVTNSSKTDIVIKEMIRNIEGRMWTKLDTIQPDSSRILAVSIQLMLGWRKPKNPVFLTGYKEITIYRSTDTIYLKNDQDLFNLIESKHNHNPEIITPNFIGYYIVFK